MTARLSEEEALFVGRLMAINQMGAKGGAARAVRLESLGHLSASADEALGEDSPVALRIRLSLEQHLSSSRDVLASLEAFTNFEDRCVGSLLLTHPVSMAARVQVAKFTRAAGDLARGIDLYRQEIDLREKYLGKVSYRASLARQNLAVALTDRGLPEDFDEAEKISRHELSLRTDRWGEQHPFTWVSHMNLANTLIKRVESHVYAEGIEFDTQHAEEALQISNSIAAKRRALFGQTSASTIRADRTRARALIALDRADTAVWILRRLTALELLGGTDEPGSTALHLARALRASSAPDSKDEAKRAREESLRVLTQRFGAGSAQAAAAKALLGTDAEGEQASFDEDEE